MDLQKITKFTHSFLQALAAPLPGGADGNLVTNYADDGPSEVEIDEWLETAEEDEDPEEKNERLQWLAMKGKGKRVRDPVEFLLSEDPEDDPFDEEDYEFFGKGKADKPEEVNQVIAEVAGSMGVSPESDSMYIGEDDDEWRISVDAGDPESGPGFGSLVMNKDGQWFMRPPYAKEDIPIEFGKALELAKNFGQSKELHSYHGLI